MEVAYACLEHPHLGPDHLEKSFTAQKATQHLIPGVKYNTISSHRPMFSGLIWRFKPCGMFKRTLKTCCLPSRRAGERGSDEHKDSGHQSFRLVVKTQQNTNKSQNYLRVVQIVFYVTQDAVNKVSDAFLLLVTEIVCCWWRWRGVKIIVTPEI